MSDETRKLVELCNSARRAGADFTTIWRDVLNKHPLVASLRVQGMNVEEPRLEIPLLNGERLLFGTTGFSAKWKGAGNAMSDEASKLVEVCNSARHAGADFTTIWRDVLNKHPLVASLPVQEMNVDGPRLEIPLLNGQRLLFGMTGFSVE